MPQNDRFEVYGRVTDSSAGLPARNLHVRAYDKDGNWDDCLGDSYTDAKGNYRICFTRADFMDLFEGDQPEIYLVIYGPCREEYVRTKPQRAPTGSRQILIDVSLDLSAYAGGPRVGRIAPTAVLPGSFVEISGEGFGTEYRNVSVQVGKREALVLELADDRMVVRIPSLAGGRLSPLTVRVNKKETVVKEPFTPAKPPREGKVGEAGPPATYPGVVEEGAGLADVGVGQRVLIILCHPSDTAPTDGGLSREDERARQMAVFENLVNPGFRQMSYNGTDFDFDYTDWLTLPETDDFYFWRNADIVAAEAALAALPADATVDEVAEAEAAVEAANAYQNLMQEKFELYHDALARAEAAGWTLTDYSGIMLCMATGHLRGQSSGRYTTITDSDGDTVNLAAATNLWVISYNAHWGRRIHELGHAIASSDIYYKEGYIDDGRYWDMMGQHNHMPLFSGYNIHDLLGWYDGANVVERNIRDDAERDDLYTLRAHGPSEDDEGDVVHLIKLTIFDGLTYYVQVRQEPDALPVDLNTTSDSLAVLQPAVAAAADPNQQLFDTHLVFPGPVPAYKGGVIVTKVVDDDDDLNQKMRLITLLSPDLMDVGGEVVDAARNLTISVESREADRPLTYRVRVRWGEPEADAAGSINLRIRAWDPCCQTNDIWVDSEANGWGVYENPAEAGTGNPTGNGDRPWVNHWNRFYASVANEGASVANDVQVTFYTNSPPGVGDSGTWVPLAVRTIPAIAAGGRENTYCNWYPVEGEHTCLKVSVETQPGETEVADNDAQENVFTFDTTGASPHTPIFFKVNVQNPVKAWTLIYMAPSGILPGWEATLEHRWLWLPPLGVKEMRLALFHDKGRELPVTTQGQTTGKAPAKIPRQLTFRLAGAIYRWSGQGVNIDGQAEHLVSIGGIQVNAGMLERASLDLHADIKTLLQGQLAAWGRLDPALANRRITFEVTRPNGRRWVTQLQTEDQGRFVYEAKAHGHEASPGLYQIQAFLIGDAELADAASVKLAVEVKRA